MSHVSYCRSIVLLRANSYSQTQESKTSVVPVRASRTNKTQHLSQATTRHHPADIPSFIDSKWAQTTCRKQEIDEALKRAAKIGTAEASAKARAALASAPTRRLRKGPIRSEAVVSGGLVYISQQTAMPPSAAGRGTEGYKSGDAASAERLNLNAEQQATKALKNVGSLLEEAGSSPSKVVSAMLCVRDIGQDLEGVEKAWGRWIDGDNPPARTVVQTGAFFAAGGNDSGVCVSVSVTAHL